MNFGGTGRPYPLRFNLAGPEFSPVARSVPYRIASVGWRWHRERIGGYFDKAVVAESPELGC